MLRLHVHHSSSPLFLKACTITAFFRCSPEGKMSRGIFRPEFSEVLSPCLNPIGVKGIKQGFDLKHVLNCFAESEPMFWFLPQECIIHTEICSRPIKGQRSLFPYLHSCGKLPWGSSAVKGEPVTAHRWRTVLLVAVISALLWAKTEGIFKYCSRWIVQPDEWFWTFHHPCRDGTTICQPCLSVLPPTSCRKGPEGAIGWIFWSADKVQNTHIGLGMWKYFKGVSSLNITSENEMLTSWCFQSQSIKTRQSLISWCLEIWSLHFCKARAASFKKG